MLVPVTREGFQKQAQLQLGEVLLVPVTGGGSQKQAKLGMPSHQRDKKHIMPLHHRGLRTTGESNLKKMHISLQFLAIVCNVFQYSAIVCNILQNGAYNLQYFGIFCTNFAKYFKTWGYVHGERKIICAFALPNERPCNGGGIFTRTEYKHVNPTMRHA